MLRLMGEKPLRDAARRRAFLGLDEDTVLRANAALDEALTGGGRLTRAQCLDAIAATGVETPGQVGYHLLWYASQVGLTCIAPQVGKEQTFVLLREWAPQQRDLSRDDALREIAVRYVRSHGPVTLKDLARWTGLGVRDCRAGVVAAGDAIETVETFAGPMLASADAAAAGSGRGRGCDRLGGAARLRRVHAGLRRTIAFLDDGHLDAVVPGSNGVFRATVVRDGRVVGTWKRTLRAKACSIDVTPLTRLNTRERGHAEEAFASYGVFVGSPLAVTWGGRP
ncbi:DNA glycosylase AlkZ-like family protein [Demequina litorisediminis]|uniref:Winged helix DNA-binding domain-containing protein n=1 Tax=Demequina litorisediminis TaxID=1849022 RepID=A0ABQ6IGJ5_9MICO|nr:crosslink repair DNA glycosylase YcaQ family protein [Demequina litorisediminis]GMA35857.1 hypothetical protein GCM10025876_20610 [Demequina litorisediminis]